jgi:hypothetical protein
MEFTREQIWELRALADRRIEEKKGLAGCVSAMGGLILMVLVVTAFVTMLNTEARLRRIEKALGLPYVNPVYGALENKNP